MNLLHIFTLSLLLITSPVTAFASLVEGYIVKKEKTDTLYLKAENLGLVEIRANDNTAQNVMLRLEDGDYISSEGIIIPNDHLVYINAINSVGLKRVLGLWRTNNWDVFEFQNFNRLKLYSKGFDTRSVRSSPKELDYSLSPNTGSDWSILIVDEHAVDVGQLTLTQNKMIISLFDRQTGRISSTINLLPIAHKH